MPASSVESMLDGIMGEAEVHGVGMGDDAWKDVVRYGYVWEGGRRGGREW